MKSGANRTTKRPTSRKPSDKSKPKKSQVVLEACCHPSKSRKNSVSIAEVEKNAESPRNVSKIDVNKVGTAHVTPLHAG